MKMNTPSSNDAERWLPVPMPGEFARRYEVSDLGRVRVLSFVRSDGKSHSQRVLKTWTAQGCYPRVFLIANGVKTSRHVHRLVAAAFIGPCHDGLEVCHNDGNKLNNALTNLRYDTRKANVADAYRHGTMKRGGAHHCARLTDSQVVEIIKRRIAGESVTELAAAFGAATSTIYGICGGQRRGRNPTTITA